MKKFMSVILAFAVTAMCAVPSFASSPDGDNIQTENVVSVTAVSAETAEEGETGICSEADEETSDAAVSAQPIENIQLSGVAGTVSDAPKAEEEIPAEEPELPDTEIPEEKIDDIIDDFNNGELGDEYYDGDFENGEVIDTEEEKNAFVEYLEEVGTYAAYGIYDMAMGFALPVVMGFGGVLAGVIFGVLPAVILGPVGFVEGFVDGIPLALSGAVLLIGSPVLPLIPCAPEFELGF